MTKTESMAEKFGSARETAPAVSGDDGAPAPEVPEGLTAAGLNKVQAQFFVAVRSRGILNAMLDTPCAMYEASHPDRGTRWEWFPPNGDNSLVVSREALGFQLVSASELGQMTPSSQRDGIVRRGDLVLMSAPAALIAMIEAEDAKAAYDDWKLPETTYKEHIRAIQARARDGTIVSTEPIMSPGIRRTTEIKEGVAEAPQELQR